MKVFFEYKIVSISFRALGINLINFVEVWGVPKKFISYTLTTLNYVRAYKVTYPFLVLLFSLI